MEDTDKSVHNFYSGLSGLQVPIPKYLFPEPHRNSSRLTYYSTFFNSIEINSSFYKLPMTRTVAKWISLVPEGFKFTFKLWKEISHAKQLAFKEAEVALFFNAISSAHRKKGCVLIQFPPSLGGFHIRQLDALLCCIAQHNLNSEWKIAVEFRNRSWYQPDVYDILESHHAALVIQDMPKSVTPMINRHSDFVYVRFHGPTGNYKDSYEQHFLEEYASYVKEWLAEGKTVYAYFNNTMGDAFKNLQTLNRLMG
jgi:uncharacterized protein YecE (DUF72 family)